jgi:hypothetical protein
MHEHFWHSDRDTYGHSPYTFAPLLVCGGVVYAVVCIESAKEHDLEMKVLIQFCVLSLIMISVCTTLPLTYLTLNSQKAQQLLVFSIHKLLLTVLSKKEKERKKG